jgi:hypothetical protein
MTRDRLAFGVTVDQIDQFNTCCGRSQPTATWSRSAVRRLCMPRPRRRWGGIFNAALAMLDQIGEQKL